MTSSKDSRFYMRLAVPIVFLLLILVAASPAALHANHTAEPTSVNIPGTLQQTLGCTDNWDPGCPTTELTQAADGVWRGTFTLSPGAYEYKAALNGSWDENYGLGAEQNGPNIPLSLDAEQEVKFYYDHDSHWITDNVNSIIANVPGDFQDEIGCPGDWAPDCLRSWLKDPDGDGIYTFVTSELPAGNYEAKVAVNEKWDENYGADGTPGGANIPFTVPRDNAAIVFSWDSQSKLLTIETGAPRANLQLAKAHWVSESLIAWNLEEHSEDVQYTLHYHPGGGLGLNETGVTNAALTVPLTHDSAGLPAAVKEKFPHLADYRALKVPEARLNQVPQILKGQFVIEAKDAAGNLIDATALQIPGVLDDLYTYEGELGVTWNDDTPTIRVWAPTATTVRFHLFDGASSNATTDSPMAMEYDPGTGVWSITGEPDWKDKYYLFEINVFVRQTGQVEQNLVTDPYSHSLSMNSRRSQIVDVHDPELKPDSWDHLRKPQLERFEDIVLYELHMRDFSVNDPSVPEEHRGKYLAFTHQDSDGMRHLRELARAGLTHLHLLPAFDIATIQENPDGRVEPSWDELASYPPDSEQQQAIIGEIRDQDAFNWGYDPFHYTVPEGSYSTRPNGSARILEFRRMVKGLNLNGLRVVMDVVYNHTNASGQAEKSVLDRIVPGYYHRLNEVGAVHTSTCCQNTATEHNMMEKLMIDSVLTWATVYKVDGFRFDLMGHHMVDDMVKVRQALDSLTVEEHGVDGSKIYVYGEGWNFGEVADNVRGINATQLNLYGQGIGTFNDRLRDAARGGGPFHGYQWQGFINGLWYDPSNRDQGGTQAELRDRLLLHMDQIRVGLAGNLRDYQFVNRAGEPVTGADVPYGSSPAGYAANPVETINYVSAHDNEALFDAIQVKAPADATMQERVQMQKMGLSLVALGQGVPFFHAGSDMLRSKSLDRNSYNSGDWFNKLDFTYNDNNWGVGLPPAADNEGNWDIMRPLLADPELDPQREHILETVHHLRDMLRIRKSSRLFRLSSFEQVNERVRFHNTGTDQQPGLIVMSISDTGSERLDPRYARVVVLFNALDEQRAFAVNEFRGQPFFLHPVQQMSNTSAGNASYDDASGTFTVPARTTAVFVQYHSDVPLYLDQVFRHP